MSEDWLMSKRAVTTADVKFRFEEYSYLIDQEEPDADAKFERWLAKHDAEVRAAATPEREAIETAVGAVVSNALNFPEAAQVRLLGQNMAPLIDKITDAVLSILTKRQDDE